MRYNIKIKDERCEILKAICCNYAPNKFTTHSFAQKSYGKNLKTEILIVKIEKKRCNFPKMVDAAITTFVLSSLILASILRIRNTTNHFINIQHRPLANMTTQIPQSMKQRKKKRKKNLFCDSTNKDENNKKLGEKLKDEQKLTGGETQRNSSSAISPPGK